jgi:ubiquinone biosynthesis protein COQ9
MDKAKVAADIIAHALPLVPFDGWNQQTLAQAASLAGYKKTDAIRVFPGGAMDAVEAFIQITDAAMLQALSHYSLETMKIRERIATIIRIRLELLGTHYEAVRRTMSFLASPFNSHRAVKSLYGTVDAIWQAAGDTSTDFNFYTKRLMLAGVYSSTLLYWLDDKTPGHDATWAFLDRRIEDVMKIEKLKAKVRSAFGKNANH